jgi:hypothetical protein
MIRAKWADDGVKIFVPVIQLLEESLRDVWRDLKGLKMSLRDGHRIWKTLQSGLH